MEPSEAAPKTDPDEGRVLLLRPQMGRALTAGEKRLARTQARLLGEL